MQSKGGLAPFLIFRRVDAGEGVTFANYHADHEEGAVAAVEVVAAGGGAQHHEIRGPDVRIRHQRQLGQLQLLAGDGIPKGEGWIPRLVPPAYVVEEDAAVASVEHHPVAELSGDLTLEGGRRDEAVEVDDGAQHGRRAVEAAEPAAEVAAGDDAEPPLADERRTEEARGVVRREAEEHLLHELVEQLLRRRRCRHAAWSGSPAAAAARGFGPSGMGDGWGIGLDLDWAEFFITVYQHLLYLLFSFGKFYPVQPMWRKLRKIVFVLIVLVNSFLFLPHNILINFPL